MGLSYHYSFSAPASVSAERLFAFLQNVEGDARLMDFDPTTVVNAPFNDRAGREFSRRVARGLVVEDECLRGIEFSPETTWNFGGGSGYCRLAPEHGVFLVVTDSKQRESVFGFFRYPRVIRDVIGREIMPVPGDGGWISGAFVDSPDPRYRSIVRRFADGGYLASERDEFSPEESSRL
jgi:hypothetical protein